MAFLKKKPKRNRTKQEKEKEEAIKKLEKSLENCC
jgi:hypothetical protein